MDDFSKNTDYINNINYNQDFSKKLPLDKTAQQKTIFDFSSNEAVFEAGKQDDTVLPDNSFGHKTLTSKVNNSENNTSIFSVEYQDGERYTIHYAGNKTDYSELYYNNSSIIIDNIGRVKTKTEVVDNQVKVSEFKYHDDSLVIKEKSEYYEDGTIITYTDGLKITQNKDGEVSVENNNSTNATNESNNSEADNHDIEIEARNIASNLHDIIYSDDWNRGAQILEILKNETDPVNIQLIIDEYKKLTHGRDLQNDTNIVSGSINDSRINKLFDSLLHFENLDSRVDNKYWQGDSHNIVREGSVFTVTNNETNVTRQIDLTELLKNCKSSKERNQLVNKLQKMPAEVLMDMAAEQSSLKILEGKTLLDMGNGVMCNAAGYYAPGSDQVAIHPNDSIGIITHEMGHALDYNKLGGDNRSSVSNNEYYLEIFNEEMEKYLADGNKRFVYGECTDISKYATTNEREMFAECYTLLMTGDCDSKKVIEKYFPRMLSYVKQLIGYNRRQSDDIRH